MVYKGMLSAIAVLSSTTAMAQVAPPLAAAPSGDQPVAQQVGGLEDIVVTARRRSESSQNIPVAVTAFSAEQIDRQNLSSLEKVGAYTPQLTIARSATGSGAQITLRGIGSNPGSIGIEQSVAVIMDGVYFGQGRVINEGFFDLAGLEVLKGPQSLFYGKNATAGVISINTANPTSTFQARTRVSYEFNAKQPSVEGFVSGPVTDTLALRLAGRWSKMYGGLVKNVAGTTSFSTNDVATGILTPTTAAPGFSDVPGERELITRFTAVWEPFDGFKQTFKASVNSNHTNNPAWNGVIAACATGKSFLDKVTPCKRDFVIRQNKMPVNIAASFPLADKDGGTFNRYDSYNLTSTTEYTTDKINVTGVLNYNSNVNKLAVDADNQSVGTVNVYATERVKFSAFSGEVRALTTFDSPINLLLGAYYQSTKRKFNQYAFTGNLENSAAADPKDRFVAFSKDSATKGETLSGYGQATWKILSNVELTGGVRYIYETKDSYFFQPYINPALRFRFRQGDRIDRDQSFSNWSPEATATWRPTRDLTLYANYKTAYKSGGFSNSALYTVLGSGDDLVFEPERASGFEGGLKSTLFDRQLRANIALYSYKYKNFQIDFQNSQTFAFITTNAGSVRAKGAELELQFSPRAVPGLNFRGTVNYSHARYGSFLAPCYSGESIAAGCNTTFRGGTGQRLDGKPTTNSPPWTGSLGASYDTDIGGGKSISLNVDTRYSDGYFASAFNSPLSYQGSYVNIDASIRMGFADNRWELALVGKNLTNNFVVTGAADAPSTGSGTGTATTVVADQRSYIASPRTIQVQATFNF